MSNSKNLFIRHIKIFLPHLVCLNPDQVIVMMIGGLKKKKRLNPLNMYFDPVPADQISLRWICYLKNENSLSFLEDGKNGFNILIYHFLNESSKK